MVIGGTSLFGGRGSIVGTLIGALIVGVFRSAVSLAGLDVLWQEFAIGVLIIVAVALDQWIRRISQVSVEPDPAAARQLVKRYGRVTALDHADFDLYPGEILAVIGDNGAGKSTLIKALCGAVIPDAGEIRLGGEVVNFRSPIDAREAGIETVYQNLALSPALSIADNMFLGREIRAQGVLGQIFRALDRGGDAEIRARKAQRARADDDPEHQPAGRDAVGRPAPGRRGGARRGLRAAASSSWTSRRRRSASRNRAACWS